MYAYKGYAYEFIYGRDSSEDFIVSLRDNNRIQLDSDEPITKQEFMSIVDKLNECKAD